MEHLVAIDIGGTKIASALVSLGNTFSGSATTEVTLLESIPTEAALGGRHVLSRTIASAQRVLEKSSVTPVGIAIASAGVIDPQTGIVTHANDLLPGWTGIELAREVEEAVQFPCKVLNDVHAHALGEARQGAGKGSQSSLVVAVGTGIGGAFVEGDTILLGAHGIAGHIGHMSCSAAQGISCVCGAEGHVESVAAGPAILEYYVSRGGNPVRADGSALTGVDISERALAGDQEALAAQARSASALGEVLGSVCNMLDPELIILSGSVAQSGVYWLKTLREAFNASAMPPVRSTPLIQGTLGGNAPLIGAAENFVHYAYGHSCVSKEQS